MNWETCSVNENECGESENHQEIQLMCYLHDIITMLDFLWQVQSSFLRHSNLV